MTARALSRRWVLGAPLALPFATAACGWHPVYGGGSTGPVAKELAQIQVALIPERPGQLLRLDLQERFERFGLAEARIYDLTTSFGITGEGIAVQTNSTVTRIRYVGTADWKLTSLAPTRPTVTSGSARVVDGLDVIDQQLFASDLQTEAVQRRMADAIADQITIQLAAFFRARSDAAKPA